MSKSQVVLTAEQVLAECQRNGIRQVFKFTGDMKKGGQFGSKFVNISLVVGGTEYQPLISFTNVDVFSVKSPEERAKNNEQKPKIRTSVSRAGALGQLLLLLNAEWPTIVADLKKQYDIKLNGQMHEIVQTHLSANNKENPGGVIEDPCVGFKLELGKTFSDKHPIKQLKGQPMTQICDAERPYISEDKKLRYDLATAGNPARKIDDMNAHLFVTDGPTIVSGRVLLSSVSFTSGWTSLPVLLQYAVIKQTPVTGFSDEIDADSPEAQAILNGAVPTSTTPPPAAPAPAVATPAPAPAAAPKPDDDLAAQVLAGL